MAQKHFELQNKINLLEGMNAELLSENETLKQKVRDLRFEVDLLKDFMDYEMQEQKDASIEDQAKLLAEKDAEIARLKLVFNESLENVHLNLLDAFNNTDNADANEKMGGSRLI